MKKVSARLYITQKIIDYIGVAFLVLLLLFIWQLYRGPIEVPFLKPYIIRALNHDDSQYQVTVDSVNIELVRSIQPIKIIANNLVYKKEGGGKTKINVTAPKTSVSFSIKALLRGVIAPSSVVVNSPTVYVFTDYGINPDQSNEANQKKLAYYFDGFEDFTERFNSEDNLSPESYINEISVNNAQVEVYEADYGRVWAFSDLNYHLKRNLTNLTTEINALLKKKDKVASVGLEARYKMLNNKLALQFYFSDLIPNNLAENVLDKEVTDNLYKINLPVSGKINTVINFDEVLKHKDDIWKSVDTAFEKINFQFEGGSGNVIFNDNSAYDYPISAFLLEGSIDGGLDKLKIKNADFDLSSQSAKINLEINGLKKYLLNDSLQDLVVRLQTDVRELSFDELYRYWPRYIGESAWTWCKDSLYGGKIENARFIFDFAYDQKSQTFGLSNLDGHGSVLDTNINYLHGMPDITNAYGTVDFSPANILVNIDKGVSGGIMLTGGTVNLYDLDKQDNFADINLVLMSSIPDALKLIDNPPLGYTSEMGLKPDSVKGNAETNLGLKFELKDNLKPEEVSVNVKSTLTDVVLPDVIQEKDLVADTLHLSVDNQGLSIEGETQLEGIPLKLVWNESFTDKKYRSRYQLEFKYNNKLKQKLGIDAAILNPPYIDGSAEMSAEITVFNDHKTQIDLSGELSKMMIDFAFLGFKKEVGQPATVKTRLDFYDSQLVGVPSFTLAKDDFNMGGRIELDNQSRVKVVDITSITGPRTNAKAKIELAHDPKPKAKINISGTSYDLSTFFERNENKIKIDRKTLISADDDEEDELEDVTDAEVFIAVNNLWTNTRIPITNFAGSAKLLNGIGLYEAHMIGNYNNQKKTMLKFDYVPRPNNEFLLSIDSNDAGSTLKVLRLYDNMRGGSLQIEARRNKDKSFIGHAKMRDFSIYNTPVIAKLLTVASFSGMVDLLMGEGLGFSHFDAPFEYGKRQLMLKNAKAFGNVVGITANGTYNRRFDELDIRGVIAPAYGLNTMIGRLPLVGSLLAGKDGTVFAADYKISGNIEDAEVNINPLSALSPSSLKDKLNSLFGGDEDGE